MGHFLMYKSIYSGELLKKIVKLKKKDKKLYTIVHKKINEISNSPKHSYKFLHYSMKGLNRVQIGNYVLIFRLVHSKKLVSFEDFDHHDKIYE